MSEWYQGDKDDQGEKEASPRLPQPMGSRRKKRAPSSPPSPPSSSDEAVIVEVRPRARSTAGTVSVQSPPSSSCSSPSLSASASSSSSSTSATPGSRSGDGSDSAGAVPVTSFRAALRAWARSPLGAAMWALAALCLAAALALALVVAVGGDGGDNGGDCCDAEDAYASSDVAEGYAYNASALHIVVAREPHTMRDVLALLAPALAAAAGRTVTSTSIPGHDGRDAMAYVRRRPGGDHLATIALPDLPSNRSFRDYGMDIVALYAYDPVVIAAAPRYTSLEQLLADAQSAAASASVSASVYSSPESASHKLKSSFGGKASNHATSSTTNATETAKTATKTAATTNFKTRGTDAATTKTDAKTATGADTTDTKTTAIYATAATTTTNEPKRTKLKMAYSAAVPCAVLLQDAARVDKRVWAFERVYTEYAVDAVECVANGTCDAVCTLVSKVAHRQDAVRALAVAAAVPVGEIPDAPPLAEIGFRGVARASVMRGLAVPRAADAATKRALAQALEAVSRNRTLARRLRALGLTPILYTHPETRAVWVDSWRSLHAALHPQPRLYVALIAALVALVAALVAADVAAAALWYRARRRRYLRELQSFEAQRTRITSPVAVVLQICTTLKPALDPLNQRRIDQVIALLADGAKVELESSVFSREDSLYLAALTNLSLQARDSATGITLADPAAPYSLSASCNQFNHQQQHNHHHQHSHHHPQQQQQQQQQQQPQTLSSSHSRNLDAKNDGDEDDEEDENKDEDQEKKGKRSNNSSTTDGESGVEMNPIHSHNHSHSHHPHINRDGNDGDDEGDEQEEEEREAKRKKRRRRRHHGLFRWMGRGSDSQEQGLTDSSSSDTSGISAEMEACERVLASAGAALDAWQFDYLDFARRCHGRPLAPACVHFWRRFRLLDATRVTAARVYRWARRIEDLYYAANPFHNAAHAVDVLQAAAWLAARRETSACLAPDDVLALLVAAAVHDAGHVARLNGFLAATSSALAITFNDAAILENNSLALASRAVADDPAIDVLAHLPPARRRAVRAAVIALVRATDPAAYFTVAESFRAKLDTGQLDPAGSGDDRLLLQKVVLRLADAAHCFRAFPVARRAVARQFEEFLQQGDEEKTLGLPVSEFMDRAHTSLDRCEVLFLESFVLPLVQSFHRYCPSADQPSLLAVTNYEKWKQRAKRARLTRYRQ